MGPKAAYLAAYNTALFLGWGYVLLLTYKVVLQDGKGTGGVYKAVEWPLLIVQTAALLEVAHSALGIVRSPVGITATQVASRLFIVWGIIVPVPGPTTEGSLKLLELGHGLPALQLNLVTLLTAWCLSEVIRYGFFALKELGSTPHFAQWLRYSGFILLYPLGVSSELTMIWLALPEIKRTHLHSVDLPNPANFGFDYYTVCILVMLTYIPGLPMLYGYMLAQRKKILSPSGKPKSTAASSSAKPPVKAE